MLHALTLFERAFIKSYIFKLFFVYICKLIVKIYIYFNILKTLRDKDQQLTMKLQRKWRPIQEDELQWKYLFVSNQISLFLWHNQGSSANEGSVKPRIHMTEGVPNRGCL